MEADFYFLHGSGAQLSNGVGDRAVEELSSLTAVVRTGHGSALRFVDYMWGKDSKETRTRGQGDKEVQEV